MTTDSHIDKLPNSSIPTDDQAEFDRQLEGMTCDGYILRCDFARVPLAILRNPDLSAGAKVIYALLVWYLHKGARYPGHAAASAEFAIPQSTLRRHLRELQAADLVQTKRHGRGRPNTYHLPDPRLLHMPPSEERSILSTQNPLTAQNWRDERSDLSTHTTRRQEKTEETLLLEPGDNGYDEQHALAATALAKVRAQRATAHQDEQDQLEDMMQARLDQEPDAPEPTNAG